MPWVIVEGAEEVAHNYALREEAVRPTSRWLHTEMMDQAGAAYDLLSHGTITQEALQEYFEAEGMGMYGRGSVVGGQPDYVINPQPRAGGGGTWLESFRQVGGASAGGGWISEMHNDAVTTPHGGGSMPMVKAFREGWKSGANMMRPRPIAAEVNRMLRDMQGAMGRTALRAIIVGRPL